MQPSYMDRFFFIIYINDLPEGLYYAAKFFTGDNSLFSVIDATDASDSKLINDLLKIQGRA